MEMITLIKILVFSIPLAFLSLLPDIDAMPPPLTWSRQRPLCPSQLALASYACSKIPLSVVPSSTSSSPVLPAAENEHHERHEHGHGHGHRHKHGHGRHHGDSNNSHETPEEHDCCRWLGNMDDECVCNLLVHLPFFLSRPLHSFSVAVDTACTVTFTCPGLHNV